MSDATLLIPNLGAEETLRWRRLLREPAPATMAGLWTLLFPAQCETEPAGVRPAWPSDFADSHRSAFAWLPDGGEALAWIPTPDAREIAQRADRTLLGPDPGCVVRVHDKAFAQRVAADAQLVPDPLRGLIEIFEPDELHDADAALARIQLSIAAWPDWTRGRFALKPRLSTSGRGRVPGDRDHFDATTIRGALPRLIEHGGALLEPWLERRGDFSVQMHLTPDGTLTLLGTLEQLLSTAGLYRGHRGQVDWRGRVSSGSRHEAALLEAGSEVARRASREGFHGACGLDAFSFHLAVAGEPDRELLRAVTEFNARFTTGTIVLGLLRRVHSELALQPGELRRFEFVLDARAEAAAPAARVFRLWTVADPLRPELRVWSE